MSGLSRDGNLILADCESVMEQCLEYNKTHTSTGYFKQPIKGGAGRKRARKEVEESDDDEDPGEMREIFRKQRDVEEEE